MRSGSVGTANASQKAGDVFRSHVVVRYITMRERRGGCIGHQNMCLWDVFWCSRGEEGEWMCRTPETCPKWAYFWCSRQGEEEGDKLDTKTHPTHPMRMCFGIWYKGRGGDALVFEMRGRRGGCV